MTSGGSSTTKTGLPGGKQTMDKDTNPPNEDRGGLWNLPEPEALKGMQIMALQPGSNEEQLFTPLVSLLPETPQSKSAILVGPVSPPILAKIAEKIRQGEYIKLQELLPARLGAPGPTILDALLQPDKNKAERRPSPPSRNG